MNRCPLALWLVSRLPGGSARVLVGLGLGAALVAGCEDPVRQRQIAALGAEDLRVPPGPQHRPGQPCLWCHDPAGQASQFTVAGTVFRSPTSAQPVGGVEVWLIDAARRWFIAHTNCAGNFFVLPQEYVPVMPLWVSLSGQGRHSDMESAMNKDGDCSTCHQGKKSPTSAGYVYLSEDDAPTLDAEPSGCGEQLP